MGNTVIEDDKGNKKTIKKDIFDNIIIEENLNMPLPEMKEKVDEYIKLLKENFTPYPEDYHNEIKHKHDETK